MPDENTVLDDDARDVLTGSAGVDWFFFNEPEDRDADLKDAEIASDMK